MPLEVLGNSFDITKLESIWTEYGGTIVSGRIKRKIVYVEFVILVPCKRIATATSIADWIKTIT